MSATRKQAAPRLAERDRSARMRVAINLLPEDPRNPTGAHWFWTRVIPEMAKRLEPGEQLRLMVSPKSGHLYHGYGPDLFCITHSSLDVYREAAERRAVSYTHLTLPTILRV